MGTNSTENTSAAKLANQPDVRPMMGQTCLMAINSLASNCQSLRLTQNLAYVNALRIQAQYVNRLLNELADTTDGGQQ